jgi:PAS domain S-box-containing protein
MPCQEISPDNSHEGNYFSELYWGTNESNMVPDRDFRYIVGVIRVLYVDDEAGLLELGREFLEMGGEFSVDTARSASEALEILIKAPYDAIISDYLMPEMDGIAFLKQVRSQFDTIPFILFTGRGREEVVIEAINNGADFYLQKGGQPEAMFAELEHKIVSAVTRRRSEDALRKSEEKFRYLVENALESVLILDFQGKILFANNAATKLAETRDFFGLLNRNVMDFIALESREDVIEDFTRVSQGYDALPANYRVITGSGKKSPSNVSASG